MGHIALRPPDQVMRLSRLGCLHPSRLSFMRQLVRRMIREKWTFARPVFDIGADGTGHAVYTADTGTRTYSLVAFAHDLPDDQRTDRVIAEAWDTTFTLHDGVPTDADIARLRENVPLQEAGRISGRELVLARANKSVRMFDHVVERLATGRQPDGQMLAEVGYLMRTTAVYGSGKFGAADYAHLLRRPEFSAPFQAELLTVFLIRGFVADLAEALARNRGGAAAVALDRPLRQALSIGNSTGLGMAPYLVTHPILLHNWIAARETALAQVRGLPQADAAARDRFRTCVDRSAEGVANWHCDHAGQAARVAALRDDLVALATHLDGGALDATSPWDGLYEWGVAHLSVEGQELLVSLMLEPHGALVDGLADTMADPALRPAMIDASRTVAATREAIRAHYGWALSIDWEDPAATARVWYVSAEKLEPRLGERAREPIAPYEQPLAPGRDVAALDAALAEADPEALLADFLLDAPEHRTAVRRLQIVAQYPYAEIRDNTIDAEMMPIDMLRAKLAYFGASDFDPRSDRWVRIRMFRGAPYPDDIANWGVEDWPFADRRQ